MKLGAKMPLDKSTVSKELMQEFLNSIPDGTPIQVNARIIQKDRPWESDRTNVELCAEWEVGNG